MGYMIQLWDKQGRFAVFVEGVIGCAGVSGPCEPPPAEVRAVIVRPPPIERDDFEITVDGC